MTAERAVMLVKKSDLFRGIQLSGLFLYFQNYYFNVLELFERKIYDFVAKVSDRCFCWFPAAMLVPIWMGTNMASVYKSL